MIDVVKNLRENLPYRTKKSRGVISHARITISQVTYHYADRGEFLVSHQHPTSYFNLDFMANESHRLGKELLENGFCAVYNGDSRGLDEDQLQRDKFQLNALHTLDVCSLNTYQDEVCKGYRE